MTNGLLEIGEILLATSQRRLDAVSRNVANATTPGFKATSSFETALSLQNSASPLQTHTSFSQGPLRATGRALDLAVDGPGFFRVSDETGVYYTRAGAFERDTQGRLVDAAGRALQSASGGDIAVGSGAFEINSRGVIIQDGAPVAQIGLFDADADAITADGGLYFRIDDARTRDAPQTSVRQGMLEASNVDLATQMMAMMAAIRSAEAGARIVQTYDGLIGQAITTFQRS